MANITHTVIPAGSVTLPRFTMTASDTIAYVQGLGQQLVLANNTGSPITATITGSVTQSINVPGYGGAVSTSGGKAVVVAANSTVTIKLDTMYQFLQGTVTVTGGTGLIATLHV